MSFLGINIVGLVEKVSKSSFEAQHYNEKFKDLHILPIFRYETTLAYRNGKKYQDAAVTIPKLGILGRLKARLFTLPKASNLSDSEVFVYDPHFKEVVLEGKSYNPFTDPILEELNKRDISAQKVSLLWDGSLPDRTFSFPPECISKNKWLPFFLSAFRFSNEELAQLDTLITSWKSSVGVQLNTSRIMNTIFRVSFSRYIFMQILPNRNLKRVFVECYYTPEAMGLIAACKELGIETIDIQHGKQGTHHLMYTYWQNVPSGGFHALPDKFWNWGRESSENIAINSSKNFIRNHKTEVFGFPWLMKNRKSSLFQISNNDSEFLNKISKYQQVILFSIQPGNVDNDGGIPRQVQETIEKTVNKSVFWLLRKHPSDKHIEDKYERILGFEHVDMEFASQMPLYPLLQKVTHHITKYSSVAFEADAFGIPTYIISDIGVELYQGYIDNGQFFDSSTMTLLEYTTEKPIAERIGYFADLSLDLFEDSSE